MNLAVQGQGTESIRNFLEVTQLRRGRAACAEAVWPGPQVPSFHVIQMDRYSSQASDFIRSFRRANPSGVRPPHVLQVIFGKLKAPHLSVALSSFAFHLR